MNYLRLPGMDSEVSVFDLCQAHAQLESDYNVGGILWERPSNRRRNASTGVQLHRMQYGMGMRWVNIVPTDDDFDDPDDEAVRDIYLRNVLNWGLPIDDEMRAYMAQRYVTEYLESFPTWSKA